MKDSLQKLIEFHESFRVNIEKKPLIPEKERCELRQRLIEEEVDELKEAWQSNDLIAVADALADIQYVVLGTVLEFGLQNHFSEIFNEIHQSNMSKLDINGEPVRRDDGKVIKSDQYRAPNLSKILNKK